MEQIQFEGLPERYSSSSLLRYPGGKSRAVDVIRSYIPDNTQVMISPFLGGGSLEIFMAAGGVDVYASDIHEPLINFWEQALVNGAEMARLARSLYPPPITKETYSLIKQEMHRCDDPLMRAVYYYIINRSSFSGIGELAGMSSESPNYTQASLDKLAAFKCPNLHVKRYDYVKSLEHDRWALTYCDPPYCIEEHIYVHGHNDKF